MTICSPTHPRQPSQGPDQQAYERPTQADQEDLLREGTPVYLEPAD